MCVHLISHLAQILTTYFTNYPVLDQKHKIFVILHLAHKFAPISGLNHKLTSYFGPGLGSGCSKGG